LKPSAHHANSGEDQTAETDDSARINGERLHCLHEGLSATETDGSLSMGNARKREGEENWSHRASGAGEGLLVGNYPPSGES
jgi:hypothetical protein